MSYYIQGLDGVDCEVSRSEFMFWKWAWRCLFVSMGAVALAMSLVAIVLMFQLFEEL